MHPDLLRDLLQRERPQELRTLLEELPLRATMHSMTLIIVRRRCSIVWMSQCAELSFSLMNSPLAGRGLVAVVEDFGLYAVLMRNRGTFLSFRKTTYSSSTRSTIRSGTT